MHYECASEKASIIPREKNRRLNDNFNKHLEIRSIKHKIIVFLSIELIVMMIYLILQIVYFILHDIRNDKLGKGLLIELFLTLVSIGYLIVFILIMTKYFPVAILMLTWLTFIQLIGGTVLLTLAIMAQVVSLSLINSIGAEILIDIMFVIIGIFIIVLSVLVILYLLNLMKLIKT